MGNSEHWIDTLKKQRDALKKRDADIAKFRQQGRYSNAVSLNESNMQAIQRIENKLDALTAKLEIKEVGIGNHLTLVHSLKQGTELS